MKKIISTLLLTSLATPSLVLGLTPTASNMHPERTTREVRATSSSTRPVTDFCSQIDKIIVIIEGKVTTAKNNRADKNTKKTTEQDTLLLQINTLRQEKASARTTQLEELSKRATSDTQKIAITHFTNELTQALTAKNKAIDTFLATHRTEVNQVATARKELVDKAAITLTADIENAKAKAKSDCAEGVQGNTVRTDLKNTLQKAQENFKKTLSSLPKKDTTDAGTSTRKIELKNIEDTFKKSVEGARSDLKNALKEKSVVQVATTTP